MNKITGRVEYIHPYGRGFLIYTDKAWKHGALTLENNKIILNGENETITIPLKFVVSIDKSISLPILREGRAFLLIEYVNIKRRETVYLLVSSDERFIKKMRFEILKGIVESMKIMYNMGEVWIPGQATAENGALILKGQKPFKIPISDIQDVERTSVKHGLSKVGVIVIYYNRNEEKKILSIYVDPMKRVFFWQLIQQMVEDYINNQVVNSLSSMERQILHLILQNWNYMEIMRKLEITEEEMENIVEKLANYGLIEKIIVLKITDRGKKVTTYLAEEFPE